VSRAPRPGAADLQLQARPCQQRASEPQDSEPKHQNGSEPARVSHTHRSTRPRPNCLLSALALPGKHHAHTSIHTLNNTTQHLTSTKITTPFPATTRRLPTSAYGLLSSRIHHSSPDHRADVTLADRQFISTHIIRPRTTNTCSLATHGTQQLLLHSPVYPACLSDRNTRCCASKCPRCIPSTPVASRTSLAW
jgi:hypothetical protein